VFLADTSVWTRRRHGAIDPWFSAAILSRQVGMCEMVALEMLHGARDPAEYTRMELALRVLPWLPMTDNVAARAMEVYGLLAAQGRAHHRSVKHQDLFIAATAEVHGVELVHYDQDFDAIQTVTGQPARWVVARGSI
jgi:predicted nucleic acid-binding protein